MLLSGELTDLYGQTAIYIHSDIPVVGRGLPSNWTLDSGASIEAVALLNPENQRFFYLVFSGETPSFLTVPVDADGIYSLSGGRVTPVELTLS